MAFKTLIGFGPGEDRNRRSVSLGTAPYTDLDIVMNYRIGNWTARHEADLEFLLHARTDVPRLLDEVRELKSQLPAEMPDCSILFKQCVLCHGRLTAANWVDHGCHTCALEAEKAKALHLYEAGNDLAADLEAEIEARYAGTLNHPSQRLRYDRDMKSIVAWRSLTQEG